METAEPVKVHYLKDFEYVIKQEMLKFIEMFWREPF